MKQYVIIMRVKNIKRGEDMLFIEYPKCSTSNKAKKWLNDNNFTYEKRNIKDDNPTATELKEWHATSKLEIKRFFNTSGKLYRAQGIKDKFKVLSNDELFDILATDGMMVKRPILIGDDFVLVGFKLAEWETQLLK